MGMFLHALCMTSVAVLITLGHCQDVVGDVESGTTPGGLGQAPPHQQEKDSIDDPPEFTQSSTRQQEKGSTNEPPDSGSTQSPARDGGKRSTDDPPEVSQSPTTRHQETGSSHPFATTKMGVPQSSTRQHGTAATTLPSEQVVQTTHLTTKATNSSSGHKTSDTKPSTKGPMLPECPTEQSSYMSSATNTSILLNLSHLDGKAGLLCVRIQDEENGKCRTVVNSSVLFNNLQPSTPYKFFIFSYISTLNDSKLLSAGSCKTQQFTRPNHPSCLTEQSSHMSSATNTSILLNLTNLEGLLCVRFQDEENGKCRTVVNSSVLFNNLQPSTPYTFFIFSYISTLNDSKLLSAGSCKTQQFTRPNTPKCLGEEVLTNRSNTDITLNFKNMQTVNHDSLCVRIQNSTTAGCQHIDTAQVTFNSLKPATPYTFRIYSYINTSNGQQLYSRNPCLIPDQFTLPFIDCPELQKWNLKGGFFIPKNLAPRIVHLNFTVTSETENKTWVYNFNYIHAENFQIKTTPGTTYTVSIVGEGPDGSWTPFPCIQKVITGLPAPNCSSMSLTIKSIEIRVPLYECSFDNATKKVLLSSSQGLREKDINHIKGDVQLIGFQPGDLALITIYAVGKNGHRSNPYQLHTYTRPEDANCSRAKKVSEERTVEILTSDVNATGAIKYKITILNQTIVLNRNDKYNFKNLEPGENYTASILAIGRQNLSSLNSCTMVVFTRPARPACDDIEIFNVTTRSIGLSVSNLYTAGAMYYLAKYTIRSKARAVQIEKQTEITALIPGTSYNISVYAVGKGGQESIGSCNIVQYTYPETPYNLSIFTIGKSEFWIKWKSSQGNVQHFDVYVNCSCENTCTPNVTHTGLSMTAYVTGLLPGTHCGATILAISGNLTSYPYYYPNITTTEIAPGIVSNVTIMDIKTNGFTVSWTKPIHENGDILNYILDISNSSNTSRIIIGVSNKTYYYTYRTLNAGICYNISIAAVNGAGEGQFQTKSIYTLEKEPSMVNNLTTVNISSTAIAVIWSKPIHSNGVVMKYEIEAYQATEEDNSCIKRVVLRCNNCHVTCPGAVGASETTFSDEEKDTSKSDVSVCIKNEDVEFSSSNMTLEYDLTGLKIFTNYIIIVRAYTRKGHGMDSISNATTSADKPSPPGQPNSTEKNTSSISFEYRKPNEQNGIITRQEIEYAFVPYNVCSSEKDGYDHVKHVQEFPVFEAETPGFFVASLIGLQPFWEYTLRVRVRTYVGYSDYSKSVTIRTLPTVPGIVSRIETVNKTSRSIFLTWKQPCHPNGLIINYILKIQDLSNPADAPRNTTSTETSCNVTDLLPYRTYEFSISTKVDSVDAMGLFVKSKEIQTSIEAPYPPGNITIIEKSATSIELTWKPPSLKTGPTRYEVSAIDKITDSVVQSCNTEGFQNTSCSIFGLDAYWNYTLKLKVFTGEFIPKTTTMDVCTEQSAPGEVLAFSVNQDKNVTAKTNVHIKWQPPARRDLNGIIRKYFIQYWSATTKKMVISYDASNRTAVIEVEANKQYTFEIFAMTIENATTDKYVNQTIDILPGAPLPLPSQTFPLMQKGPSVSDDQKQISIAFSHFALCDDRNGEIKKWFIIVSKGSKKPKYKFHGELANYLKFIKMNYTKWTDVYEKDVSQPYIATDSWHPNCSKGNQMRRIRRSAEETITYVAGSGGDCEGVVGYCDGAFEPGKKYRFKYTVCTEKGCLESDFSDLFTTAPNYVSIIAGLTCAFALAIVVVIVVTVYLKRKRKGPFKKVNSGESGQQNEGFTAVEMTNASKPPKAIRISEFASYVQKMHADSNLLFSNEYKMLKETCPTHTTKAAEIQVNRIKNRYTNILAYDHSRVKLLPTEDDEGSDYINANYIPGFSSPREYIATQGPLPFTRDEFWRMIWEQNVSIIVMLTQLVERGRRKCDIYWPESTREPVYYGDLVVETESESTLPDYVLRVLSVKLGDSRKTVKHFSYLAWPDMGIPETSESMLKFTKEVRSHLPPPTTNRGPIAVHCSAGVGRTGTFIAVDYLMQHVTSSDVVDIYNFVMKMRNNRPNMVQTEDQYIFIHDCIKDYVNRSDDDSDEENEEGEGDQGNPIYANM